MSLLYKEDWEETKERFLAWWSHENTGRCGLAVTAPRNDAPDRPRPPAPTTVQEQWYDLDLISQRQEYHLSRTYFGGEALPVWSAGYAGNSSIPVFLGAPITLDTATGWVDPILKDPNRIGVESLKVEESCSDYIFTLEMLKRAVKESEGKCLPTIGAFGGGGDTLAALRGTQQLLMDCIERPDEIRAAEDYLMQIWCEVYDTFYGIIRDAAEGSTCWFTLWSPGRFYSSHNDFSYNISPKMFREIFIPAIHKQTEFLDHSVYHVDGICAFAHVDALCDLPNLQALQILPGAGKPSPLHYLEVLKQVQARGKNLHISIPISEVKTALSELSARGLFIQTSAQTEDEARELLKKAEQWSKDR